MDMKEARISLALLQFSELIHSLHSSNSVLCC